MSTRRAFFAKLFAGLAAAFGLSPKPDPWSGLVRHVMGTVGVPTNYGVPTAMERITLDPALARVTAQYDWRNFISQDYRG